MNVKLGRSDFLELAVVRTYPSVSAAISIICLEA